MTITPADLEWLGQTIHQTYHGDQPGTFETCPRSTCQMLRSSIQIVGVGAADLDEIERRWHGYRAFASRRGRQIVKDDAQHDVAALIADCRQLRVLYGLVVTRLHQITEAHDARVRELENASGCIAERDRALADLTLVNQQAEQNVGNLTRHYEILGTVALALKRDHSTGITPRWLCRCRGCALARLVLGEYQED